MLEELYQKLSQDSDKIREFIMYLFLTDKLNDQEVEQFISFYQEKLQVSRIGTPMELKA